MSDAATRSDRPRLLDLFCGAGGAAVGYDLAGFEVVGVDIEPHPDFPFEFVEEGALAYLERLLWRAMRGEPIPFEAIHASPPCQEFSSAGKAARATLGKSYVDLYVATRSLLEQTGLPWVIENVTAAPSRSGVVLCGSMFGLPIRRHRTFESSHLMLLDRQCDHKPDDAITVTGHSPQRWLGGRRKTVPPAEYQAAMGIDWMRVSDLVQAVPPAYTRWIGAQLMPHVRARVAA